MRDWYLGNKRKLLKSLFVVLLLISLPTVILLVQQQQDIRGKAASPDKLEVEQGTLSGAVQKLSDSLASGGSYVLFSNQINSPTPTPYEGQIVAFPGAQGFGASSKGGRGGVVYEVTSLNNSGSGTLRACIQASGPRTCIFRVGGTINSSSKLSINNPFITIAGQTAPGGGIAIKGAGISVRTNDVIIRGLRIRPGDGSSDENTWDAMEVLGSGARRVIIDHNSISWAIDENVSTWYTLQDVTFSWNIVSEALHDSLHDKGPHSMGFLVGGEEGLTSRISIHHNLLAHNNQRNFRVQFNPQIEIVNNIIYNWGEIGMQLSADSNGPTANFISNYYKVGSNSSTSNDMVKLSSGPPNSIYVQGNISPHRLSLSLSEWSFMNGSSTSLQRSSPWPMSSYPISYTSYPSFTNTVYQCVGAIAPVRDNVDNRIISNTQNGSGSIIDSQSEVGGWPSLSSGSAPQDSDHDGMPNSWENSRGLNPNNASDRNGVAPSGYTWLEEYINFLISCL